MGVILRDACRLLVICSLLGGEDLLLFAFVEFVSFFVLLGCLCGSIWCFPLELPTWCVS